LQCGTAEAVPFLKQIQNQKTKSFVLKPENI